MNSFAMKKEDLFELMNDMEEIYIAEAADSRGDSKTRRPLRRVRWAAGAAACLAILLLTAAGLRLSALNDSRIELSEASVNVTARYADPTEMTSSSADLAFLTEEEIFHKYNTIIFRGTVTSIRNIELNYNGEKEYQAIAEIRVSRVYRGECRPGDTLKVLLPCPIMEGYSVSETGTASATRTGTEGIFMPIIYDDSSTCSRNGATLHYTDIADYGFWDGERWAFLDTPKGLIFGRSYQYESLADAQSLDDIERYILKMLGQ